MTFIDPTDIHMTGAQADHFSHGQTACMRPDHSMAGAWWIEADNGFDRPTIAFRLASKSDALVGMARIARIRPDIPLEINEDKPHG